MGPHENMDQDFISLRDIRDFHEKHMTASTPKHLIFLLAQSKIYYFENDNQRRKYGNIILDTFESLNEIPWAKTILKIVSTLPQLPIFFNFDRETVDHMDPTARNSAGIFYRKSKKEAKILIGAFGLQSCDQDQRKSVEGTLIHELTHLALNMVYTNKCKPYANGDVDKEEKFKKVVETTRKKVLDKVMAGDEKIREVFNYPEHLWEAELIARVLQIMAVCKDDSETFSFVFDEYHELLTFFQDETMKDLELYESNCLRLNQNSCYLNQIDDHFLNSLEIIRQEIKVKQKLSMKMWTERVKRALLRFRMNHKCYKKNSFRSTVSNWGMRKFHYRLNNDVATMQNLIKIYKFF